MNKWANTLMKNWNSDKSNLKKKGRKEINTDKKV